MVDDEGNPVAGVPVVLDAGNYQPTTAITDSTGTYKISINSPTATVHYVEPNTVRGYTKLGAGAEGAFAQVTTLNATTYTAPDLVVDRAPTVTGLLTDGAGHAVSGGSATLSVYYTPGWANCVAYYYYCTNNYYPPTQLYYDVPVAADGTYSTDAPAGSILVPHKVAHYTTPADSLPITGDPGGTSTVDFVYRPMVTVTGALTAPGTLPSLRITYNATDPYYGHTHSSNDHYYSGTLTIAAGSGTYSVELPAGAVAESTWYLRLQKTGTLYTSYLSWDGLNWLSLGNAVSNQSTPLEFGLMAIGSSSTAAETASFDYFHTTTGNAASCSTSESASDEFDGTTLDVCRWDTIVREDPGYYGVAGGALQITTEPGDHYYCCGAGTDKNLILQTAPAGDWTIETKVHAPFTAGASEQAGLLVYYNDDNYVKFIVYSTTSSLNRVGLLSEEGGYPQYDYNRGVYNYWSADLPGASGTVSAPDYIIGYGWSTPASYSITDAQLVSGTQDVGNDFTWVPESTISGSVVDENLAPLPNAFVQAQICDSFGRGCYYIGAISDAGGGYSFSIARGNVTLSVPNQLNGYGFGGALDSTATTLHVALGADPVGGQNFQFIHWVDVSFRATGSNGPIPSSYYYYYVYYGYSYDRWGTSYYFQFYGPADGTTYALSRPVGTTQIYFYGINGYLTPPNQSLTIPAGGASFTFTYVQLARFGGTFKDSNGNPVGTTCPYYCNYVYTTIVGSGPQDVLSTWIYLDPAAPPSEIIMQFYSPSGGWEHRAYWGNDLWRDYGSNGHFSRERIGDLPAVGQWVQLLVPTSLVGLSGQQIQGVAYALFDGAAWWDLTTLIPGDGSTPIVIADDSYPADASVAWVDGGAWVGDQVYSGLFSSRTPAAAGFHQHYFYSASGPTVRTGPAAYYSTVDGSGIFGYPNQYWYPAFGSSTGTYVLPGTYTIYPPAVSPYQAPAPQTVAVSAGSNPALALIYTFVGTIQGTVKDNSGIAIAGVTVCDETGLDCGLSSSSGAYSFHVPLGSQRVVPQRFVIGYAVAGSLGPFDVTAGSTTTVDITYVADARVIGLVSDDLGAPLAGETIAFDYRDPVTNAFLHTYTGVSGSDGTYSLDVPYGVGRQLYEQDTLTGYEPHSPGTQVVDVIVGVQAVANFSYDANGSLIGTLLDRQGNPVVGAVVTVYGPSPYYGVLATTNAAGVYLFASLTPGGYYVYPGAATGYVTPAVVGVTVPVRDQLTQNFLYVKLAHVTGHTQDDLGNALPGAQVYINGWLTADASGNFDQFLSPGTWTATPGADNAGFGYVTPSATQFTIAEGQTLALAPIVYVRHLVIHVPIFDQDGKLLRDSTVYAYANNGQTFLGSAVSGFDAFVGKQGYAILAVAPSAGIIIVAQPRDSYDAPTAPANVITTSGTAGQQVVLTTGFTYLKWGTVNGHVFDDTGAALTGVQVTLSNGRSATTNTLGFYSVTSPHGDVTVTAARTNYVTDVEHVTVASGLTSTVDLHLTRFGRLVGTLLDESGGPVSGAFVYAYLGPALGAYVQSQANGSFSISIAPGTYRIVPGDRTGYVTPSSADGFVVTSGTDTPVTLGAYQRFGTVDGYVLDKFGHPLGVGAFISLVSGTTTLATTTSDPTTGHYVLSGRPGSVGIVAGASNGWDAPAAIAATIVGGVDQAQPTLTYLRWGRIVGRVLDPSGNPVQGIVVYTDTGQTATTDASGNYAISAPRGTHVVYVQRRTNYVTPSDSVSTVVSSETDSAVADRLVTPYRALTVTVTDSSGVAVVGDGGTRPSVYAFDNFTGGRDNATVDADGKTFHLLVAPGATTLYAGSVTGFTAPAPTPIAPGQTSAALQYLADGFLHVLVANDLGPLGGVGVTIISHSGAAVVNTSTDQNGSIRIRLDVGSYDVRVGALPNTASVSPQNDISIFTNQTTELMFNFRRYGELHGFVLDDVGTPIANATVVATLTQGSTFSVQTDATGFFKIRGPPTDLVSGQTYSVQVLAVIHYETPAALTGIQLGDAGQPTGSVDLGTFVLLRFAQLQGHVIDNVGNPVAGVTVHAQENVSTVATDISKSDGSFTLWVKQGSDYRVFGDDKLNYVTPVPTPAPGQPAVTVAPGDIVTGLDLVYQRYLLITGHILDNFGDLVPGATIGFSGDAPVAGGDVIHINKRYSADVTGFYAAYVPPGSYLVAQFPVGGYLTEPIRQLEVRELPGGSYGCFLGTDITVQLDCANYDWTYTHGYVSGFVVDDQGHAVPNVLLQLKGVSYTVYKYSALDGSYSFGAPPDDYAIIGQPAAGYTTPIAPLIVHMGADAKVVQNVTYVRAATVTGRAVDANTGSGLAGVIFEIRNSPDGGKDDVTGTTDAAGYFSILAPAGNVIVYPGVAAGYGLPPNLTAALTPGVATDVGSFSYLSAVVNGIAQDSFGVGLAGVTVEAQDGGGFYNSTITNPDGTFSIHVHVGTSYLHFSGLAGYEQPPVATLASVPAGVYPTPVVAVYGNARITGTVLAAATCPTCSDTPVGGAAVLGLISGNVVGAAVTQADGSYVMSVPAGNITVLVSPLAHYTPPAGVLVSGVTIGQSRTQDLTISVNGRVSGVVQDDNGAPIDGVLVVVGAQNCATPGNPFCSTSHNGGQYSVEAPSGAGSSFTLATAYVDGYTRPAPLTGLTLTSGQTRTQDLVFFRNGSVSGTITDSGGNPLGGGLRGGAQGSERRREWTWRPDAPGPLTRSRLRSASTRSSRSAGPATRHRIPSR